MSQPVISVSGLGKRYHLTHQKRHDTLRDSLTHGVRSLLRRFTPASVGAPEGEEFWALRDVTFDVHQGDVIGIIGRNGAGKSTLLKILSRITEPTTGSVRLRGRIASLLEVGTGFHPELSGRENIFLNGAILGMSRVEITRKFDEIVAFAEVERFLDTQVKHYSSGMYVRLAFAVAAHLEPEILIVDEVLAVGDAQFQKKCLGKMSEVARAEGRTVLFVSHNMVAVQQLCQKGVWLADGRVQQFGHINEIVHTYMHEQSGQSGTGSFNGRVQGDGSVELVSYRVHNAAGLPPSTLDDLVIKIVVRVRKAIGQPACGVAISNEFGILMTSLNTTEQGTVLPALPAGESTISIRIKCIAFLPGTYTASFWVMNPQGHIHVMVEDSLAFELGQVPLYGTRHVDHRWGCVYSQIEFAVHGATATSA